MKQINLRLTELTLAAIDELRGLAPRNAWIAEAVDEKIARESYPALAEEGRRLASKRDDLIASGVNPADLAIPLAPLTPEAPVSTTEKTTGGPCPHPKKSERLLNGGAVLCGLCGARVR